MTICFFFFIIVILPDVSLTINKSKCLIPILQYINAKLQSLTVVSFFGVLGRTLVNAVYWKTETESFYCSLVLFFLCVTTPHINMLFFFLVFRYCKFPLEMRDTNGHHNTWRGWNNAGTFGVRKVELFLKKKKEPGLQHWSSSLLSSFTGGNNWWEQWPDFY